jgi:hypothetical protein
MYERPDRIDAEAAESVGRRGKRPADGWKPYGGGTDAVVTLEDDLRSGTNGASDSLASGITGNTVTGKPFLGLLS